MSNVYDFWNSALAGVKVGSAALPVHENLPQAGFYRVRTGKNGPWEPVAIFEHEGSLVALRAGNPVDAGQIWTWACRNPVTYEAYTAVVERGEAWPDEPPAPTIGHNSPSDPFEALRVEYEGEAEQAREFLKTPITTQEQADQAAIWAKRLAGIAKKATDLHKVEKQPSLDEGRRVDDKWRDLKTGPDDLSKQLKRHQDAFLRELDRLEQERQRKAREEADRLKREADEAAAKASSEADDASVQRAEAAKKAAEQAERETQARNIQAGRTGAKVALRTFVSAEITDFDALLMALKDRPEITEAVQSLANRAAKSGVSLPGMTIKEEKRAA